jgi:hypothetical protein
MVAKYGREKSEFHKYQEKLQKSIEEIESYSEAFW